MLNITDNCRADINLDGVTDVSDVIELLSAWNETEPCHYANLTGGNKVGVDDLIMLVEHWGACYGFPAEEPDSLEDVLISVGLTMQDWDDFIHVQINPGQFPQYTPQEQQNWRCWMWNYLTQCKSCPSCAGPDPFDR